MASTFATYPGDGSTNEWTVPFPYLSKDHVHLYVNDVEDVTPTWLTDSVLAASVTPPPGSTVLVKRITPRAALTVIIPNAGTLRGKDINTQSTQALYVSEEGYDALVDVLRANISGTAWDAQNRNISNVSDPEVSTDAATKGYVDTRLVADKAEAAASAAAAAASATAAAGSASVALSSKIAAATSEGNAAASQTAAAASATTASTQAGIATTKAAQTAADAVNTAADRSAVSSDKATVAADKATVAADKATVLGYKNSAATSESNASASATAAAGSASSALASKNAAATSEANAAGSASAAAGSASSALASKNAAATSETNAGTSASSALASKNAAATSETNAAASAAAALASKNAAATSETNAASSATSASGSATSASSTYTSFDKRYLGPKSSAPTVDNQGAALQTGALYWDTVTTRMMVWNGSGWADFVATFSTAASVPFTPAGNLSSTNVQAALQELDSEKAPVSHTHAAANITDFTEAAQDAIGALLTDSTEMDFTYDDAGNAETLALKSNSVAAGKLAATATNRIFGRKTAGAGGGEELTINDILSMLLGVDGSGSGLDADKLDGQEGSYFYSPGNPPPAGGWTTLSSGALPSGGLTLTSLTAYKQLLLVVDGASGTASCTVAGQISENNGGTWRTAASVGPSAAANSGGFVIQINNSDGGIWQVITSQFVNGASTALQSFCYNPGAAVNAFRVTCTTAIDAGSYAVYGRN